VVRQKRERERAERDLLDLDSRQTIPYIKPFGERFDPSQLPYFKYRKALAELELEKGACLEAAKRQRSSDLESEESAKRQRISTNLNIILYIGLGTMAIGLIITFVGIGEKGFKTIQLRLVGPMLILVGVILIVIRVIMCTVPDCYNYGDCNGGEDRKKISCCSLNDVENLEEKLGATKHLLQNGRTVVDIERNASYCISSKRKKEFDTQISKETQISAIISDTDEDSDEDKVERKPCI